MIISYIMGGLGNQMFQYAFGKSAACRFQASLKIDVSDYTRFKSHNGFELESVFNAKLEAATEEDFRQVLGWRGNKLIRQQLLNRSRGLFLPPNVFIQDLNKSAVDNVSSLRSPAYLHGVWQSQTYFEPIADHVRSDFVFATECTDEDLRIREKIAASNSVSLHVRRGDYVSNSHTNSVHGVCSIDYYLRAINYLSQRYSNLSYFIFSDDIEWTKNNIEINAPVTFVAHNQGARAHADMKLMQACRHHIIANSTFSWWGAWLSKMWLQGQGSIIAPTRWAAKNTVATQETIPSSWVRI